MNKQKGLAPVLIVILIALAVGGYLLYQKQLKPVPVLQPVIQASPSTDEIANWKTYTNEIGYSLKHPQNWDVIRIPDSPGIIIAPQEVVNNLKNVIKTGGETGSIDQEVNKYRVIVVVPDSGKNSANTATDIAFENKNKPNIPIRIILVDPNYQTIYQQILSTFKFTN